MIAPRRAVLARRAAVTLLTAAGLLAATVPSANAASALPAPVERTLGNGLRVVVFPETRLELVQIQLRVPAGFTAEPQGAAGVAYVTAEMLRRGTTSRDPRAFANAVERTGGSIVPNVSRDFATLGGMFLARDFEAGMELMSDAVLNPVFDEGELRRVKSQALRLMTQVQQSNALSAEDHVWKGVFGEHPYGRSRYGEWSAVAALDPARTRGFWSEHWRPDRSVLAIAGDITPERAFLVAEEWFGRWSGNSETLAARAAPQAPARMRIRILDRPGERTELRIGALGPARGAEGEFDLLAASALYGGAPVRRPNGERTLFGRDVRSAFLSLADAGLFTIAVSVSADSVGQAVRSLTGMMSALATPASAEDLASVQRLMKNTFLTSIETLAARTSSWLTVDSYGHANEFFERYDERVDALNPNSVAGAARRWLDPTHVVIVATGPAARLRSQLESLGDVEVVQPAGAPAAGTETSPASAPSASPAKAAPTPAQLTRGRELVRKSVLAHGGLTKLRGIQNSRIEALITLNIDGQKLDGLIVQARREPDRMVYLSDVAGISTRQTLVGDRAWQMSIADSVATDMDSVSVAALRAGFSSDLQHLLLIASDPKSVVWARGRTPIEGVNALEVVVEHPAHGERTLYLHPVRHRLIAFDQGGGSGAGLLARRKFSDFRPVDGILWPYREERLLNGETVMVVDVRDVRFNTDITDSAFEKPKAGSPPAR